MIMSERHEDRSNKSKMTVRSLGICLVLLLVFSVNETKCSDQNEITKRINILESVSGRLFSDVYQNGTFRTGNMLWDNILNKCTVSPSVSCLQKNVYSFLDDKLGMNGDVEVTSGVCFKKNNVDIHKYSKEANTIYLTGSTGEEPTERYIDEDKENEIDNEESESPLEEVTDALYDKSVKFLVTHDMKVTLPETFFQGATVRISPRALTKTGALVHIELEPRTEVKENGRLFFHKIKKYLRKKLITAAIAIILVVKLIALKLVFVLPLIMGITTAKKMFLKFLLFLFPALSHIFKLCSWYHQNYHTTKFHHHHHLITHHHKTPHHQPYGPPSGHASSVVVRPHHLGPPPTSDHYGHDNFALSGAGLGTDFIIGDIHRNAIANFKPTMNDMQDIKAWGLGLPPGPEGHADDHHSSDYGAGNTVPLGVGATNNIPQRIAVQTNAGRPVGPPLNPYYRNKKTTTKDPYQAEKEALIRAAALAARAPPSPVRDEILRVSAVKLKETNRIKTETDLVKQQQQILAANDPETIAAEKFYGQLVETVDGLLAQLGATEPGCKERAICAMYGDPFKHTPYSNLVSGHLSKDSNELLPAGDSKMAIYYYRYVQAARDGQEQKDCHTQYPNCDIEFQDKKRK